MTQEQIQVTEIQALRMPAIAIRGLVMFPKMVLHFDVARQKSILALNQAMKGNQKIFLVTQKNSRVEEPGKEDLYTVGVVAKVKQILKAQGEAVRVVVEGKYRARMCELIRETPYYEVLCQEMPMEPVDENKQELVDAYMRVIKDLFEDYSYYAPKMPKELVINIIGSDDPIYLTEYLTQNLGFPLESKQQILEESNVRKRLELLSTLLHRESEVLKIEHSIAERVKDQVDRNQKEYYLREQLKAIHAELGDDDDPDQEIAQYYEKLRAMNPDEETRQKLSDEINKLSKMMYSSQEAMVSRNYLDTVFSLPWNQFTEDKLDVKAAEEKLNADHYGLQKVKERILEILAVRKLAAGHQGPDHLSGGPSRRRQDFDCARPSPRRWAANMSACAWAACATRRISAATARPISARCPAASSAAHQAGGQHEPADAAGRDRQAGQRLQGRPVLGAAGGAGLRSRTLPSATTIWRCPFDL